MVTLVSQERNLGSEGSRVEAEPSARGLLQGRHSGGEDSLPGEQDSFSLGWPSPSEPAVL